MGLFDRFRKSDDASASMAANDAPIESVERIRRRAIQRLIGSCVLVALGVGVFAFMFDRQPRPVAVDIPIEIPDKKTVKQQELPVKPPSSPVASAPVVVVLAEKSLAANEKILPSNSVAPAAAGAAATVAAVAAVATTPPATPAAAAPKTEAKNAGNTVGDAQKPVKNTVPEPARPEPAKVDTAKADAAKAEAAKLEAARAEAAKAEAARAKALLEGGSVAAKPSAAPATAAVTVTPAPAADSGAPRFIVQFGSFAESARAQEARRTVEKAGLKTYAQEASTDAGKRIRTRVGPFATRAEADAAAAKIKALGLPANVLAL